jgi:UDP-glucose-4-epimerase GalE
MATRVLVTGGAGYVGAHCCKALSSDGFVPVVVDNLSRGDRELVRWGPLVEADIADSGRIAAAIREYKPSALIHFAAFAYVGESVRQPLRYYRNNVVSSVSLFDTALGEGLEKIVFSSSCATYGIPDSVPIDESHRQLPVSPYGNTKLAIERLLADLDAAGLARSVSLRYFNAAGADPDGEIGERHDPETHAIPLAVRAALDGNYVFEVLGTDYDTPDGTAVRDYVHVSDLADAHLGALRHLLEGGSTTALNLGSGRGHSVRQVLAAVKKYSGRAPRCRDVERRPGDPAELVASAERARRVLGWRPRRSSLEEIVRTALRWHRTEMA